MDIYSRPASRFVATFVGSPTMNFMPVRLADNDGHAAATLPDGAVLQTAIRTAGLAAGDHTLGIRAEAVRRATDGDPAATHGRVEVLERLGDRTLLYTRLKDGGMIVAEDIGLSRVAIGDEIGLSLDGARTHLFDAEGRAYHAEGVGHG